MHFNKILWATDGSDESGEALKYVRLIADRYNSVVVALSVIEPVDFAMLGVPPEVQRELISTQLVIERKEYERMVRALSEIGISGDRRVIRVEAGIPYEEIIRVSEEEGVDLIVMGKRGLGIKDRILLGSNTIKVLRTVRIPVLAVRRREGYGENVEVRKILVPTDLSEVTRASLKIASDLALKFNCPTVYLLHVVELRHHYELSPPSIIESLERHALIKLRAYIEEVGEEYRSLDFQERVSFSLSAWHSVVEFAGQEGIDLIVMPTHGRKGILGLILVSVAEKVINEAPCPVLAIKSQTAISQ